MFLTKKVMMKSFFLQTNSTVLVLKKHQQIHNIVRSSTHLLNGFREDCACTFGRGS
jgi:hypothetical protein